MKSAKFWIAGVAIALAVAWLVTVYRRTHTPVTPEPDALSKANYVSVVLGKPNAESGGGLDFVRADLSTNRPINLIGTVETSTNVILGRPCRQINMLRGGRGYFYFTFDPDFKKGETKQLRVDVEYFDSAPGLLTLQFDGSKTWQLSNPTNVSADEISSMSGTKQWKSAVFHIRDGTFNNAQEFGADFRLRTTAPEICISRVIVTRVSEQSSRGSSRMPGPDFSTNDVVSLPLGDPDQENGQGLQHLAQERDGLTDLTELEGTLCRYSLKTNKPWAYFYFIIDDSFKAGLKDVDIEVECYPIRPMALNVEFDASDRRDIPAPAYAKPGPDRYLMNTMTWQTNVFHIRNATFANAQNGHADFRITIRPPQVYIRRITVSRQGPRAPLPP